MALAPLLLSAAAPSLAMAQVESWPSQPNIVVVMIDNEATVKSYHPEGDRIRLQPANDAMEPIYVKRSDFRETQIIGVVVGVYRKV